METHLYPSLYFRKTYLIGLHSTWPETESKLLASFDSLTQSTRSAAVTQSLSQALAWVLISSVMINRPLPSVPPGSLGSLWFEQPRSDHRGK
ncbi:Protein of unknown function [Pyronema omphalodes CBS 100304]|uniref:Uncharacterized protein n=1 Tax=Pyronema omphalodes (strain CBS 100304) TaxID=1076935 RepID=U4LUZ0_PYROM|nr:Protein of unknown function [Pyronema omphalodes CBS 100304]